MQNPFLGDTDTGAPMPPSAATSYSPKAASGKWKWPWAAWKMKASGTRTLATCDHWLEALWVKSCCWPW